jgi:hypothetical protein
MTGSQRTAVGQGKKMAPRCVMWPEGATPRSLWTFKVADSTRRRKTSA